MPCKITEEKGTVKISCEVNPPWESDHYIASLNQRAKYWKEKLQLKEDKDYSLLLWILLPILIHLAVLIIALNGV